MSDLPGVPLLVHSNLPKDDRNYMVAALGPVAMDQPGQPLVTLTLTSFLGDEVQWERRNTHNQSKVELHVADLMTIGTGEIIAAQRKKRTPRELLTSKSVRLDMAAQLIQTFAELEKVFGPKGSYPLRATWQMVKHLKCLVFTVGSGTVLIPCLDAWRFTFGASSKMLSAITQVDFIDTLTEARQHSVLNTPDGPRPLPIVAEADSDQGTLSLHVPTGYTEGDVATWAWLVSDRLAADAASRFHSSLSANHQDKTRFSSPRFEFPFSGQPKFNLRGVQLPHGQFLALQIVSTDAALPIPPDVVHDLLAPPEVEPDEQGSRDVEKRGSRTQLNGTEVNVDSLRPPDARLTTLHLGLRQDRFSAFKRLRISAKDGGERRNVIDGGSGETNGDDFSSGGKETDGDGGRQMNVQEQLPPPSRPVDHVAQFCDLHGVCKMLLAEGIQSTFHSIERQQEDDPTTPIPASAGASATWVGKGIKARRALIARLSRGKNVAYALEWERISPNDYGKLLLVSAGQADLPDQVLLDLLNDCAAKRGVWDMKSPPKPERWGFIHQKDKPTSMGARITAKLVEQGWFAVPKSLTVQVETHDG